MKKIIFLFLLILGCSTHSPDARPPKSWPTDGVLVFPNEDNKPILIAIEEAKHSIELVLYRLEDAEIINQLIEAKKRGVTVRIILQKPNLYPEPFANTATTAIVKKLNEADIEVHYLEDHKYILTHYKFMIVDKDYALVQTLNYDDFNFKKARNFAVTIQDPKQVSALHSIFENDFLGKSAKNDGNSLNFWKKNRIVLGPTHQRSLINKFLLSAHSSVYIYQQDLSDIEIGKTLKDLAQKGIKIYILMSPAPFGGIDFNRINCTQIQANGGEYRFLPKDKLYIHAKIILVDPEFNGRVYVGSCNLWAQSLTAQRELGIVINNAPQVQKIFDVFKQDWATALSYEKAIEESVKSEDKKE